MFGWLICFCLLIGTTTSLRAQGTAFTYQGQLNDSGSPADGRYDLTFTLYSFTNLPGTILAGPITNAAVTVTNGLFTTTLDFGPGVFTGTNYWLQIGVRTNGGTTFTALSPRQQLTPVPYAIFANTASNLSGTLPSSQLSGALPSSQISGTYSSAVIFSNGANSFIGAFTGVFNGNGSSLSNLNASQLTSGTVADARLSSNVALLNANQQFTGSNLFTGFNTFTGTNILTGVNIFTNTGNSFRGSFFGNGLVGWIPVNATALQAVPDTGYLLASPELVAVTLPASPSVGDIVRISGAGAGGWLVRENSGQSIIGNFAAYRNAYLAALLGPTADGHGIAGSADGVRMYAVGNDIIGVYGSPNSGQTWTQVSSTGATGLANHWYSVACSANGKIVYAEPAAGGTIQKSTDYGVNWAATASSATGTFISCSADGSLLFPNNYACSGNGTFLAKVAGGVITISTNGGSTFNVTVTAPAAGVTCLGASSDCTRLVAGVSGGLLYASSNQGATWTTLTATNQAWSGAWMSPDGSKFAATVSTVGSTAGNVYNCNVSVLPNTSSAVSTGSIVGSQGSAVELQYIGNNQFMPVSTTGMLWAN
jgi:hypothetical protein